MLDRENWPDNRPAGLDMLSDLVLVGLIDRIGTTFPGVEDETDTGRTLAFSAVTTVESFASSAWSASILAFSVRTCSVPASNLATIEFLASNLATSA